LHGAHRYIPRLWRSEAATTRRYATAFVADRFFPIHQAERKVAYAAIQIRHKPNPHNFAHGKYLLGSHGNGDRGKASQSSTWKLLLQNEREEEGKSEVKTHVSTGKTFNT
jgi:hypothetical protein